jgi:putative colanic acid biosynthesis acetyltransferase WcaF
MSYDLIQGRRGFAQPTFTRRNRLLRALWSVCWFLMARWTPPLLHRWRIFLLNLFGARVSKSASVYSSAKIWAPWNLTVLPFGTLGPEVYCYNIAPVSIGLKAIVSQGAFLCTGTHDYRAPDFPLVAKPITISDSAWICARAFVGPGVTVGSGAVLGAMSVATNELEPWTVYAGNPAIRKRNRPIMCDEMNR